MSRSAHWIRRALSEDWAPLAAHHFAATNFGAPRTMQFDVTDEMRVELERR